MKFSTTLGIAAIAASLAGTAAQADKLDDIISSGTLRCAVVLDFPPMGSRDAASSRDSIGEREEEENDGVR